jgi:tetratricopeptide (TPR) repeat protein
MDYDRLRELQEKFEENPRRYFAPLANEYRKGGQPKRAIEICRSQLSQMPGHMSGQIVYGQSLYETGEFEEARLVFERALTLDPENLIALRSLGDMSLQSGNTVEARKWYMRLLDADPKDAPVIALVSEIDASTDARPVPTPQGIPGVDIDGGDQAIPFIADAEGAPVLAESETPEPASPPAPPMPSETAPTAFESAPHSERVESEKPAERTSAPEPIAAREAAAASEPTPRPAHVSEETPVAGLERHYPIDPTEAGLPDEGMGAEGLHGGRKDDLMGAEGLLGTEPESPPEPVGAEGLSGKAPPQALAGTTSKRSDDEDALDTWTPPPDVAAPERIESPPERSESPKEERMFSGPGPEPFVNETMAQLYLQQGYRQLALRVYYQLAESRPDDQTLKARIKEIETADHAAHPDSPVPPQAAAHRESIETPRREEPRAAPENIAARQPSIREFFATLGRRRPPRSAGSPGGSPRPGNSIPAETVAPMGSSAPSASLDAVFAGATVSASDSRAASRLAGAFSGTAGASRATPLTPPVPTPRVNARMPHTQESEEDVAKFRAWLDGLTGE